MEIAFSRTAPFFHSDETLPLLAIILSCAALAVLLERTRAGRLLSAPATVTILAAFLSNCQIIPFNAPIYDNVVDLGVPIAIPLLLFKADIRRIIKETGTMSLLFLAGATFTTIGAFVGMAIIDLGPEKAKIAGAMTASYIGGSMNFVAVSKAVEFDDSSTVSAALAADNVIGTVYLVILAVLIASSFLSQSSSSPRQVLVRQTNESDKSWRAVTSEKLTNSIVSALAVSVSIVVVADAVSSWLGVSSFSILFVTLFTVLIANVFRNLTLRLVGEYEIGTYLMYLFFAVVGAQTNIAVFLQSAMSIALFVGVIVVVHSILLGLTVWIFRLDWAEAAIASNACVLGPSTAAVMAASRGWSHLVTPAILLGIAGYVIANFIGVAVFQIFLN